MASDDRNRKTPLFALSTTFRARVQKKSLNYPHIQIIRLQIILRYCKINDGSFPGPQKHSITGSQVFRLTNLLVTRLLHPLLYYCIENSYNGHLTLL